VSGWPGPGAALRSAVLTALVGAMSGLAWLALWRLETSPWGHWIHAHGPAARGHGPHDGSGVGAISPPWLGLVFVAGWVVMTVAMMLPTTLPLLEIFHRLTARRRQHLLLLGLVGAGYLAAWAAFGAVVFGASLLLRAGMADLAISPGAAPAALLLVAGAFQFSRVKYRCLERCRSPLSFVTTYWRGANERWQSFRLGFDHGVFCVGCCWALMLLMFATGTASLAAMLTLGAIMAVEKNAPWGRGVSAPLGALLLAAGLLVLVWPD
jgi:predicted metal-binding membrane protein